MKLQAVVPEKLGFVKYMVGLRHMKTVELRRHSIKLGTGNSNLSPDGIELAKKIGQTKLQGKGFTHLFISPLQRTTNTMNLFAEGAEDFPSIDYMIFPPHMEVSETDLAMKLWTEVCHTAEKAGEDMMEAAIHDQAGPIVAKEASESFRRWLDELPEDSRSLVVGHSPFIELIVFGLFGKKLTQLQPGEGVVILKDKDKLILENRTY